MALIECSSTQLFFILTHRCQPLKIYLIIFYQDPCINLYQGGYFFPLSVCLFTCWLICQQEYIKYTEQFSTIDGGLVQNRPHQLSM